MATTDRFKAKTEAIGPFGRYRLLSPNASVRLSPIVLGAGNIGNKWASWGFLGVEKEESFKLLDAYFDNGGNFIDTANSYQEGDSEKIIGEWAESRGIRDQVFIATKYANQTYADSPLKQKINYIGNGAKSLNIAVKESLKNLRTDYIDLLYVHFWDFETTVGEVMRGLHHLVTQGKVLYLGISDAPAWIVSKANQFAVDHGLTPFSVYQGRWSVMDKSFERDIIPMARAEGLALAPWGVLAGGKIRSDEEEERRRASGEKGRYPEKWERNEQEKAVCKVLEKVAADVGTKSITAVAIAYVLQRIPYVFPILGGRKPEQFLENAEALNIVLTPEHRKLIDEAVPFDIGFPSNFIGNGENLNMIVAAAAFVEKQPLAPAIQPSVKKD